MSPRIRDIGAEACRALAAGTRFRFVVSGRSMEPALLAGDEVEAERLASPRGATPGDLVVIGLPDQGLVVHRLIWRRSDGSVRTRGDGSRRVDPIVRSGDLLGRVVAVHRDGRVVTPGWLARRLAGLKALIHAAAHRLGRRLRAAATASPAASASR